MEAVRARQYATRMATTMWRRYDGNIGAPLMAQFRWTLDLESQPVVVANATP